VPHTGIKKRQRNGKNRSSWATLGQEASMTTPATRAPRAASGRRFLIELACVSLATTTLVTGLPVATLPSASASPKPVAPSVRGVAMQSLASVEASRGDALSSSDARSLTASVRRTLIATTPGKAQLAAVSWPAGAAPAVGTAVSLRGRTADGWTPWLDVEVSGDTDPSAQGTQRLGTDPAWLGEGVTSVQVRYAAADRSVVSRGRIDLIDPGTSPADAPARRPAAAATAVAAQPTVISRAAWGADERIRSCPPSFAATTKGAVLHHTAGTNSYTASQSAGLVRGIYAYHAKSLGWCDIGYNMLVDKYGQIFEGRFGGLDRPVIGAHTLGFNTNTFGVSVLGTYTTTVPSAAATNAVTAIMAWRLGTFYVDARGTTQLVSGDSGSRYKKGTVVTLPVITGHRDTVNTSCPGTQLWNRLATLRSSVGSKEAYTGSVIYKRYAALGGSGGRLGLVSRGEASSPLGLRTLFTGGSLWNTAGGMIELGAPFGAYYEDNQGPSLWGRPTGNSYAVKNGQRSDTTKGITMTWSSATGTHHTNGLVRTYWTQLGDVSGVLGYPTATMMRPTSTGYAQDFQGGTVYYSAASGVHHVSGPLLSGYRAIGGPASAYGFPTAQPVPVRAGLKQSLQGGNLWYSTASGAHPTAGPIQSYWLGKGGPSSWLGFPTSGVTSTATDDSQSFQAATIRRSKATGRIVIIQRS
jgi:uncharacterized protein with LGFP repeats